MNNVKEVKVTDDFLTLDRSTIGCQNDESIDDILDILRLAI